MTVLGGQLRYRESAQDDNTAELFDCQKTAAVAHTAASCAQSELWPAHPSSEWSYGSNTQFCDLTTARHRCQPAGPTKAIPVEHRDGCRTAKAVFLFVHANHNARLFWLRDNIYRHGQRYPTAELILRITGRRTHHLPLIETLRAKQNEVRGD